ncbi:carboxymuconolactone decarboxylase family protein [Bdellovibrio sp.]|uniref:carboxymuconolactone decarboxylase family protein n=1 Tax=Bdellovibrio TaxID=958 RepID=UPI00322199F5
MLDWKTYLMEVKSRIAGIAKMQPDLIKGYRMISDSKAQSPVLDGKTRELIALAVAITTRCDGCISVHIEAAKKHGATREEILEALGVAVGINTGTALIFSARAMDAYDNI